MKQCKNGEIFVSMCVCEKEIPMWWVTQSFHYGASLSTIIFGTTEGQMIQGEKVHRQKQQMGIFFFPWMNNYI